MFSLLSRMFAPKKADAITRAGLAYMLNNNGGLVI
jgi:hypothetical protein